MILQALVNYYELLNSQEDSEIPNRGFCTDKASYSLDISNEGNLLSVTSLKVPNGKKLVPRPMKVPERVKRSSGVCSNFLCDNSSYVLGFDGKGKPENAKKCFLAFKELHEEIFDGIEQEEAKAVLNFLNNWDSENGADNPIFKDYLDDILKGANFVFRLEGMFVHENDLIQKIWLEYLNLQSSGEKYQCLVTGEKDTIARLHPVIKGLYNGQSMGNQLVSFNAKAYESYGKEQGQNAQTGEYAAFAYGTALNYLLSSPKHKMLLADMTVVYWAETLDVKVATSFMELLQGAKANDNEQKKKEAKGALNDIQDFLKKASEGIKINYNEPIFNDKTKIFILGLSPNAARISVRFFIEDCLGEFNTKMIKHYEDMAIQKQFPNEFDSIPIWKIVSETAPSNSRDKKPSPLLAGSLLRAILTGGCYPENLYRTILERIRAERYVTYVKAAVMKAYLSRKYKYDEGIKEVLTMALNKDSNNKSYLLGRLFSVLEKTQRDANPEIKSTIADKYLSSACSTPGKVFPTILKLSTYHIAKAKYGYLTKKNIEEIMSKFDVEDNPFPKTLKTDEQAIFYLGYYQQNKENYNSKDKEDN